LLAELTNHKATPDLQAMGRHLGRITAMGKFDKRELMEVTSSVLSDS